MKILFNPSQKYFSTTLITSMSAVIHQVLVKKNSTKQVRFCWPLIFGPIDRCAYWRYFPLHFKFKGTQLMLCWLADDCNPQLDEIISNFQIINKRIFSVAGRMFKPERCRLTSKRFEASMFINCNNDFEHCSFLFNLYLKFLLPWSNWREGSWEIWLPWPAQCKDQAPLSLYFGFNILLIGFQQVIVYLRFPSIFRWSGVLTQSSTPGFTIFLKLFFFLIVEYYITYRRQCASFS